MRHLSKSLRCVALRHRPARGTFYNPFDSRLPRCQLMSVTYKHGVVQPLYQGTTTLDPWTAVTSPEALERIGEMQQYNRALEAQVRFNAALKLHQPHTLIDCLNVDQIYLYDSVAGLPSLTIRKILEALRSDSLAGEVQRMYARIPLDQQEKMGVPSIDTFQLQVKNAVEFLVNAWRSRVEGFDEHMYSHLLAIWANLGDLERTLETVALMRRADISLTVRNYNNLLQAISGFQWGVGLTPIFDRNLFKPAAEEALLVLKKLIAVGLTPNHDTYAFLALACARAGRRSDARQAIDKVLRDPEQKVKPTAKLQSVLTEVFLLDKRIRPAALMLDGIARQSGSNPSDESLAMILSEATRLCKVDAVFKRYRSTFVMELYEWMNPAEFMRVLREEYLRPDPSFGLVAGSNKPAYVVIPVPGKAPMKRHPRLYEAFLENLLDRQAIIYAKNYLDYIRPHLPTLRQTTDMQSIHKARTRTAALRTIENHINRAAVKRQLGVFLNGRCFKNGKAAAASLEWERRLIPSLHRDWTYMMPVVSSYRTSGGLVKVAEVRRMTDTSRNKLAQDRPVRNGHT